MFNLKAPRRNGFLMCNNADIDWYVRKPTNPPLVDPKVEMLPELCQEEGVTLEPTVSMIDIQFPP